MFPLAIPTLAIPTCCLVTGGKCGGEQSAVGMPQITSTVSAFADLVKIADCLDLVQFAGMLQSFHQMISFGIDVSVNVMSNLTGCVTEPDTFIVCCRAHPCRLPGDVHLF
jgi:hypothetical protein